MASLLPDADGSPLLVSSALSHRPPGPQPVAPGAANVPSTTSVSVVYRMALCARATVPRFPVSVPDVPVVRLSTTGCLTVPTKQCEPSSGLSSWNDSGTVVVLTSPDAPVVKLALIGPACWASTKTCDWAGGFTPGGLPRAARTGLAMSCWGAVNERPSSASAQLGGAPIAPVPPWMIPGPWNVVSRLPILIVPSDATPLMQIFTLPRPGGARVAVTGHWRNTGQLGGGAP